MCLVDKYIDGLKIAFERIGAGNEWDKFMNICCGITAEDEMKIRELYPDVPESLIELLRRIDGTYYREYGDKEYCVYLLCTDVSHGEYPYYLYSASDIIEASERDYQSSFDYLFEETRLPKEEQSTECDARIKSDGSPLLWLCFSDCMNNGGTSQIFIDFTPSETGKIGQVIRFLHDPDCLKVVADSFDEYLSWIIENDYPFINEETAEDIIDKMS